MGAAAGQAKARTATKLPILPAGGLPQGEHRTGGRRAGSHQGRDSTAGSQEFLRILGHALHQHLEVQVRSGRAAAGAHLGYLLAAPDQVALLDVDPGGVCLTRD